MTTSVRSFSISISNELADFIDGRRRLVPRSAFIEEELRQHFHLTHFDSAPIEPASDSKDPQVGGLP
jgi:hypothetical protein